MQWRSRRWDFACTLSQYQSTSAYQCNNTIWPLSDKDNVRLSLCGSKSHQIRWNIVD